MERLKNKLLDFDYLGFLSGKWVFGLLTLLFFFPLHESLCAPFLETESYSVFFLTKPLDLKNGFEQVWYALNSAYTLMAAVGIFVGGIYFFRSVIEPLPFMRPPKLRDEDITAPPYPYDPDTLQIILGQKHKQLSTAKVKRPTWLTIPEKALFQNFLITGTTGTGKTASTLYPMLKQLMGYKAHDPDSKAGMLILDVKGNFYLKVLEYAKEAGRESDVVLISPDSGQKYNPLHKPDMDALDLAERCQQVTEVLSAAGGGKNERFWKNKSVGLFTNAIKLARATNPGGYITMHDIHKICSNAEYGKNRMDMLTSMLTDGEYTDEFDYEILNTYFTGEYANESDGSTMPTIMACATEITEPFVNSKTLTDSFCPPRDKLNFTGFSDVINSGKIVVLAMNSNRYPKVAAVMAAYAKLDFESEVLARTEPGIKLNTARPVCLICDEYQTFTTSNDAAFLGLYSHTLLIRFWANTLKVSSLPSLSLRDE